MATLDRPPLTREPPRRLSEAELAQRWQQAFPEAQGPGQDHESGAVTYDAGPDPRVGRIPHLLDPAIRDRENAERAARLAAMTPAELEAREDMAAVVRAELRGMR
jgi:hypothetical protein